MTRSLLAVIAASVAGLLVAVALVAAGTLTTTGFLIVAIALVTVAPLAARVAVGRFDAFEPIVLMSFGILLLFVARPIYESTVLDYSFLSQDLDPHYEDALLAVLVALIGFQVGYHLLLGGSWPRRLPPLPGPVRRWPITAAALALTAVGAVALVSHAQARGTLFGDRAGGFVHGTPIILQTTVVAVPALLLFFIRARAFGERISPIAIAPLAVLLLIAIPAGNRRFLLPLLVVLYVWYYLGRARRPSLGLLAVLAVGLMILVVGPLREYRSGDSSLPAAVAESVTHPLDAAEELVRSQDSSPISNVALSMAVLGDEIPYRHGEEVLTSTVLAPFPGEVFPGKPEKTRTLITDHYYGTSPSGDCTLQCPVFGFVTDLYADFGLPSLALGSVLLGALFGFAWAYLRRQQANPFAQALLGLTPWVAFYPWWSALEQVPVHILLFVVPLLVVSWAAGVPDPVARLRRSRRWVVAGAAVILAGFAVLYAAYGGDPDEPTPHGISADQQRAYDQDGNEIRLGPSYAGFLDSIERVPGGASVGGWAVGRESPRGPERILVYVRGRLVTDAPVSRRRPDVARYFGSRRHLRSGFAAVVPERDLDRRRRDLGIRVVAVGNGNKEGTEIRRVGTYESQRTAAGVVLRVAGGDPVLLEARPRGRVVELRRQGRRLVVRGTSGATPQQEASTEMLVFAADRLLGVGWPLAEETRKAGPRPFYLSVPIARNDRLRDVHVYAISGRSAWELPLPRR